MSEKILLSPTLAPNKEIIMSLLYTVAPTATSKGALLRSSESSTKKHLPEKEGGVAAVLEKEDHLIPSFWQFLGQREPAFSAILQQVG